MEFATTPLTIFWSWQSDTPHSCGKDFVREVLLDVAKLLNQAGLDSREEAEESPVAVDHDTLNVGGSPHIAETVFDKITKAAVFVADITPVGFTGSGKPLPNPNVMLELGWALCCLKKERVILIWNDRQSKFEQDGLPFDLRHLRWPAMYSLTELSTDDERAAAKVRLLKELTDRVTPSIRLVQQGLTQANALASKPELSFGQARLGQVKDEITSLPLILPRPKCLPPCPGDEGTNIKKMGATSDYAHNTQEKIKAYNYQVAKYQESYQRYRQELLQYNEFISSTLEIYLTLENSGIIPVEDLTITLTLPSGFDAYKNWDALPSAPIAPRPPERPYSVATIVPHQLPTPPNWGNRIPDILTLLAPNSHMEINEGQIIFTKEEASSVQPHYLRSFIVSVPQAHPGNEINIRYKITSPEMKQSHCGEIHIPFIRESRRST